MTLLSKIIVMRHLILVLLLIFGGSQLQAQIGLRAAYDHFELDDFQVLLAETQEVRELPGTAYSLGVDYWFRLKNKRIEFTPELNYARTSVDLPDGTHIRSQWFSFFFNTNFYVFDLASDCDCPTFSKQNNLLESGFFVSVSPGVTYAVINSESDRTGNFDPDHTGIIPSLAGGIGLDLGVSDFLTLTPFAEARYLFPFDQPAQAEPINDAVPPDYQLSGGESQGWRFRAGLRMGFRFDYR
jgi:hypothetical protein